MEPKPIRAVTCEGRFSELRGCIGDLLKDKPLSQDNLQELFDLFKDNFPNFDQPDNYFDTSGDNLRFPPREKPASLVPLLARTNYVSPAVFDAYIECIEPTADRRVVDNLRKFNERAELSDCLRLGESFSSRYRVRTNFGVGHRTDEAIVSDSPFNIEIWQCSQSEAPAHALTVGFWYRKMGTDEVMVVDQIQEARTDYQKIEKPGVLGLAVACDAARVIGMDKVWVYPSQKHPIFRLDPAKRARLANDFKKLYDESALELKFDGDESTFYTKSIKK